jgi:hypothetical protein
MSVSVESDPEGQAFVGEMVNFVARVDQATSPDIWYRYRARRVGGDFQMIRDLGPEGLLQWTASDRDGAYEIEATVRDNATGDVATVVLPYRFVSRVSGTAPVVNPTTHPLVALYSAPACAAGGRMAVEIRSPEGIAQRTNWKDCSADSSMNFYLAGMRPLTTYRVHHVIEGPSARSGPELQWTTSDAAVPSPGSGEPAAAAARPGFLLFSTLNNTHFATDLMGRVVWYYPGYASKITRPTAGGTFTGLVEEPLDRALQLVREWDLVGMTVRETNVARMNEQLVALGRRTISGFHHEARPMPDGGMLVLAAVEEVLEDTHGPGWVNVVGDMIIVLDRNLQPVWVWDSFDFLDTTRRPILGETCTTGQPGCPPIYLDLYGVDWVHGNSVALGPDGNLVYSARHQDFVYKIDYASGSGSGAVLWRLGEGGDFQAISGGSSPWFSHQHDAEYDEATGLLLVFDNGNTRRQTDGTAQSRGQAIRLDEQNLTAEFILNAELGAYSAALGSARRLPDGHYQFDLGIFDDFTSSVVEVDANGALVYQLRNSAPAYRVFRMGSMYAPY